MSAHPRVIALCLLTLAASACSTVPPAAAPAPVRRATAATTTRAAAPAARQAPKAQASASRAPVPVSTCAQEVLRSLTPSQVAAQVFDVGLDVAGLNNGNDLVAQEGVGGVFLSGRSQAGLALAPPVANLKRSALAAGRLEPFVSADEEGGVVQSVRGPGIPPWPSAQDQSTWTLPQLSSGSAAWAASLHTLGITLNLGPVSDVVAAADQGSNPPIGALGREYGATAGPTADRVAIVTAALQRAGVGATAKHFPGLGRVRANTDTSTLAQDDAATAADVNLMPFEAAIHAGATAVMVSSARYPLLDPTNQALWSARIITTLLRSRLGFTGLVISDDISNAVAVSAVLPGDRAIRFLQAGGDMVLIVNRADLLPMLSAVQVEAADSPAFAAILRQAAQHVVQSKIELGLVSCPR